MTLYYPCCLRGADGLLLGSALAFEDDALEFFEDGELFVGVVDFGVALLFGVQETDFFEALELALNVAGVFFDKFGEAPDMRLEIGIFGVNHNDLTSHSRCDKHVKHFGYTPLTTLDYYL